MSTSAVASGRGFYFFRHWRWSYDGSVRWCEGITLLATLTPFCWSSSHGEVAWFDKSAGSMGKGLSSRAPVVSFRVIGCWYFFVRKHSVGPSAPSPNARVVSLFVRICCRVVHEMQTSGLQAGHSYPIIRAVQSQADYVFMKPSALSTQNARPDTGARLLAVGLRHGLTVASSCKG